MPQVEKRNASFPLLAQQEARAISFTDDTFRRRRVVRGFTIDDADTSDMDDAIWLEKKGKGYELTVSIADVTAFVPLGSALDREAYDRKVTLYYPDDMSSPMFPERLSNGLFSLQEKQRRPTVTITTIFDENLERSDPIIALTQLESERKYSYEDINEALNDSGNNLHASMTDYADLANNLREKRKKDGGLIFSKSQRKGKASIIIEEFMVATNVSMGTYLSDHDMPALYRNHLKRLDKKAIKALIAEIEASQDDASQSEKPKLDNKLLGKAVYCPSNEGHSALRTYSYMHGTSPIRRYADIVNHRGIHAVYFGEEPPYSYDDLVIMSDHLNS